MLLLHILMLEKVKRQQMQQRCSDVGELQRCMYIQLACNKTQGSALKACTLQTSEQDMAESCPAVGSSTAVVGLDQFL